ncbi:MAG: adenylyltransferase/cytidyltransferase family protein, partial [Planctomycetota bacterium]
MNTALYAGSFDPLTLGHLDVIIRAAKQCDKLVVGIGANPAKKKPFLPVEVRVELIRAACADRGID